MSKLSIRPNAGYTKPQDDAASGNYPNTIVEAIFDDKKKQPLEETLDRKIDAPNDPALAGKILQVGQDGKIEWVDPSGGGGSCPINILTTDLNLEKLEDYGPTTRQGLAEYFGITEEQLQDLYDGKYNALCGPDNIICWLSEHNPNNGMTAYSCLANYGVEIYCFGDDQWAKGYMFD